MLALITDVEIWVSADYYQVIVDDLDKIIAGLYTEPIYKIHGHLDNMTKVIKTVIFKTENLSHYTVLDV